MKDNFIAIVFVFLFAVILGIPAEEKNKNNFSIPKDTNDSFTIGFSKFIGKDLGPENEYLTYSIPLLLYESLATIGKHRFAPEEQLLYKKMIVNSKIRETARRLSSVLEKRDLIFFQSDGFKKKGGQLGNINRAIESTRNYLNYLRNLDAKDLDFPDIKPVKIMSPGDTGKLYEEPKFSALQLAVKEKLDILVWGRVEQIGDTLFIEIHAFERAKEQNVFNYTDAGARENIYKYMDTAIKGLADVFLGTDWGNILVKPNPTDASVYVDDNFVGRGKQLVRFVPAGTRSIKVSKTGYISKSSHVDVRKHETIEADINLERKKVKTIKVESVPSGATVYVNSIWKGKTPLLISKPARLSRLLFKLKDYKEREITLSSDVDKDLISVKLERAIVSGEEIINKRRDRVYMALGWWFLSIPLPIFTYGYAIDYKLGEIQALLVDNNDTASKMAMYSDIMYYGYLGGLFINAGLLVNVIFDIIDYIRAVEED